jgi:hypothetical protein
VINALFGPIITFRHGELKAAWGAIYAAEAVALENFRSKFNVPLEVDSQGFCVLA